MLPTLVSTELFHISSVLWLFSLSNVRVAFVTLRPPLDILLVIVKNVLAPRVNITWINRAVDSLCLLPVVRPSLPVKHCRKAGITHHSRTTMSPLWPLQKFWWSPPLWKNLCTHWIVVDIVRAPLVTRIQQGPSFLTRYQYSSNCYLPLVYLWVTGWLKWLCLSVLSSSKVWLTSIFFWGTFFVLYWFQIWTTKQNNFSSNAR